MDEKEKEIVFTYTHDVAPLSVTGKWCGLKCAHCNARYLEHMLSVDLLDDLYKKGKRTFLISGGMDRTGHIPYNGVIEKLEKFKSQHPDVRYNFHTGFVDEKTAGKILKIADGVSLDFVGSGYVVKEVYGLKKDVKDYLKILQLFEGKVKLAMHLTIGLLAGKLSHEFEALNLLSDKHFDKLVFLVFIPTRGTKFEKASPPKLEDVERVFKYAREIFPTRYLALGCMQPTGRYRYELQKLAIDMDLDEIVNPVIDEKELLERGYRVIKRSDCCVF